MALFGLKKKTDKKADAAPAKAKKIAAKKEIRAVATVPASATGSAAATHTILRPRVTEKSGLLSQSGVYTFEVTRNADKHSIVAAVTFLYKVVPTKVAIVNLPDRNVFVRGRRGVVPGVRKALVTLKKGDKIDFV